MSGSLKLAIIITCYNYENFIRNSISSVVGQIRSDCELVVIDDGSTDASWTVIQHTGVNAYRVENGGQLAACILGLERTTAPFILFLDADDMLAPGALDVIVPNLTADVAKLQFPLAYIDADGYLLPHTRAPWKKFRNQNKILRQILRTGVYRTPPTSGNVFRRDVCQVLYEVDYERAVDGVILSAAPLYGEIIGLADELGFYRIHGRNDSGLGRLPEAATLERDLARYRARMEHLAKIVGRRLPKSRLKAAQDTFYYREREFYLYILNMRRPTALTVLALIKSIAAGDLRVIDKATLTVFVVLMAVLPNQRAKTLLRRRFSVGNQSKIEIIRAIFGV